MRSAQPFRGPAVFRAGVCLGFHHRQVVFQRLNRGAERGDLFLRGEAKEPRGEAAGAVELVLDRAPTPTALMAAFMTRGSPMTRDTRGSLIRRIARPTTTSFTASNIDMRRLCHAATLASTRRSRHARLVSSSVERKSPRCSVDSSPVRLLFGWLGGPARRCFRIWHFVHAPRWMLFSGVGYICLMLAPALVGLRVRARARAVGGARLGKQLARRSWRGGSAGWSPGSTSADGRRVMAEVRRAATTVRRPRRRPRSGSRS